MKYLKINSKPFHVVQYVDKVVNTIVALNHAGCKHRSCDLSKTLWTLWRSMVLQL